MRRALELAGRGWGRVAPNPLVGAVVVKDGEVVGKGWHAEFGGAHAEPAALAVAGERARGADLYVTLEPCAHSGKTPPCSEAILAAGVARVVFAAPDPSPDAGGGAAALLAAGVDVVGGVEEVAARDINAPFFFAHSEAGRDRPWVCLKLALSLDSSISDRERNSSWITGPEARADAHRLRAGCDAVAVGVGTALSDDPELTVRHAPPPRRPTVRVVFDRSLRLPPGSRLAQSARDFPLWVIHADGASVARRRNLEALGTRLIEAADDLPAALHRLRGLGVGSILVEGGAGIASTLLSQDLVDRMELYYAPVLLGPGGLSPFAGLESPPLAGARRWRRVETRVFASDTRLTLAREVAGCSPA
ncbi:MAG: bifunctional diaminohydroxyphosphoribosylaminopyrimidine deaminase/5-amino-6-(5-phosphoribosylamino)uracil reductase RibD [Longimicrobiaceae bacterium]